MHFSKILICRVKYSRASEFSSGSGDVSATYYCLVTNQLKKASTYQVENRASQNAIDGEVNTSLHAQKSSQPKRLQDSLLHPAQEFRGRIAYRHVVFPSSMHVRWLHESKLWSV